MFQYGFEGLSLHVCHRVMADAYRPYLLRCKILFSKKDYSFARQAIPGIIQSLATTLDNVLLLFIDEDLKQYRATHGISPQKLKAMSSEESKQALDAYFQRLDSEGLVTHFLSGKCKDLNFSREAEREHLLPSEVRFRVVNHPATIIDIIAIQFIANMELMLRRVSEDRPLILEAIYALNSVPIPPQLHNLKLTAAKLLESDAHRFGKQVMKLAFQYSAGPILIQEELIYKPSSIAIETVIAGNVSLLRRIDPSYPLTESCFELINDMLSGEVKLPTYLMMPRGLENPKDAYGYKQVIKCEPYPELDLDEIVIKGFGNLSPSERESKVAEFQNRLEQNILKMIRDAVTTGSDKKYDCVTTEFRDLEFFSKQCGMLFAAFYVLKIGDMHAENMLSTCVANGKQIVPVDLENAFNPIINPENIAATESLQRDTGGFSRKSCAPINFSVLLGIEGMLDGKALIPSRNLLYLLTEKGELRCVAPILEDFCGGVALILNCIIAKKDRLRGWLQHHYVQNCLVRVLPFNTTTLQSFRYGAFLDPTQIMMSEESRSPTRWLEHFARKKAHEELGTTVALTPSFYVASKPYSRHEALSYSVPIYYVRANNVQLLDGRGELVDLDPQDRECLDKEIENGSGKRADGTFVNWQQVLTPGGQIRYCTIPPVEAVVRFLDELNDQVVSKIIEFVEERARKQRIMRQKREVQNAYFPEETVAVPVVFEVKFPIY